MTAPDLLSRIAEQRSEMSKGERRIADAVLNDIEFAVHASTAELARAAKVSPPTITRFCHTTGCSGVQDFKLSLAKTLTIGKRYLLPQAGNRDVGNIAGQTLDTIHRALDTLAGQLNMDDMQKAADMLASAGRIFVFGGGGGASSVAQDTEYRLFRLGLGVISCNDAQLQQMMAATCKKQDVLFAISTAGVYPELVKAAEIARQYGAQVLALTAANAPLSAAATLSLPVDIPETEDIMMPTASRFALLATVDILATLTAIRIGEPAREILRRIKYQLVSLRGGNRRPLGD